MSTQITATMVNDLRRVTGAGLMKCKAALVETGGNVEEASTLLRKQGEVSAAKKADRDAKDIAATGPSAVNRDEIPAELVEQEREIATAQAAGKPPMAVQKIVEGKLEKFYAQSVLLDQPFVKNPDQTIRELVTLTIQKTGENIQIRRFTRYQIGS
jgi:elongation factor Ts